MEDARWHREQVEPNEVVVCDGHRCAATIRYPDFVYRRLVATERVPLPAALGAITHTSTLEYCELCYAKLERIP